MSYLVLARKWRPQGFADMVGQQHIARVLTNAIQSGRIAHCYLFTGVRGVGKTSAARILAKALNCEAGSTPTPCNECVRCKEINEGRSIDVYEIDGASNRGIDEVRQIIENVRYQPAAARFKVYIIDEVHQVTKDAFNALLKTLEEPPPFAKFILATTEVHRLPETILSRCQRFDFRRIEVRDIHERLRRIADVEGLNITDGALALISRAAQGSMRDAQSLLEQVLSFADPASEGGAVDEPLLRDILGVAERRVLYEISAAVVAGDPAECLRLVAEVANHGVDLAALSRELVEHFRNLLVVRLTEERAGPGADAAGEARSRRLMDLTDEEVSLLHDQVAPLDPEALIAYYRFVVQGDEIVARSPYPRFDLEASLVRVATLPRTVNIADAIEELQRLEQRLDGNGPVREERAPAGNGPGSETEPLQGAEPVRDARPPGDAEPARKAELAPEPEPVAAPETDRAPPPDGAATEPARPAAEEEAGRGQAPPEPTAAEWSRFLEFVASQNRLLASTLQQGSLLEISAAGVKIGLEELFHLSYLRDGENMALFERYLEEFFRRKMTAAVAATEAGGSKDAPAPGQESAEEIIDEALRIFGGTVK